MPKPLWPPASGFDSFSWLPSVVMGILVDGKRADEVLKAVDEGKYDEVLKKFESQWSQ